MTYDQHCNLELGEGKAYKTGEVQSLFEQNVVPTGAMVDCFLSDRLTPRQDRACRKRLLQGRRTWRPDSGEIEG